jgi:hypothetical protein
MSPKPVLKTRTETVHSVGAYELSSYIKDATGHDYDVQCNEEIHDSEKRINVDGKLHTYEQERWEEFKETGEEHSFWLDTILNGLCKDGFIPAGIYLVAADG